MGDDTITIEKIENGFTLTENWKEKDDKGMFEYKSKVYFIQYAEELGNFVKEKFDK